LLLYISELELFCSTTSTVLIFEDLAASTIDEEPNGPKIRNELSQASPILNCEVKSTFPKLFWLEVLSAIVEQPVASNVIAKIDANFNMGIPCLYVFKVYLPNKRIVLVN